NQRETIIAWSKQTGLPIYKAIVWQDRRTSLFCEKLEKQGKGQMIYKKTGLRLDPYFSASKINWILNNVKQAKNLIKNNDLLVGTVDTWLIWKLTNGQNHLTDVSNASRTMLFNINSLEWDKELIKIFNIPQAILPKVISSADSKQNFGLINLSGQEIPILAVCGDQTSALYGEQCFKMGDTKATFGTGGFVVVNAGKKIKLSNSKLITTVGWRINKETIYALEGSIFQSGGSLKWLRDNLGLFKDYEDINSLSKQAKDSQGVYLIPAFVGLGAPYWLPKVHGLITGLTHQTQKGHLINAAIEAAAFQVNDLLEIIKKDYNLKITKIKVDGGLTKNPYLLQFQADISNVLVSKSENEEMTARGVALMAAKILNWSPLSFFSNDHFKPLMTSTIRKEKLVGWEKNLALACHNT
ncbi:MAG: glycerol kinase GlpK, partial [Candidatus Magasanikbacteria bacterium]|nr:glycerol kinase GlpK [Candidatus Magasanikbacteria bacterium]